MTKIDIAVASCKHYCYSITLVVIMFNHHHKVISLDCQIFGHSSFGAKLTEFPLIAYP